MPNNFAPRLGSITVNPVMLPPGVGEALHEAISHRVTPTYEYDGDRPSRFLCRLHCCITVR